MVIYQLGVDGKISYPVKMVKVLKLGARVHTYDENGLANGGYIYGRKVEDSIPVEGKFDNFEYRWDVEAEELILGSSRLNFEIAISKDNAKLLKKMKAKEGVIIPVRVVVGKSNKIVRFLGDRAYDSDKRLRDQEHNWQAFYAMKNLKRILKLVPR
jgi:hypothetical protein